MGNRGIKGRQGKTEKVRERQRKKEKDREREIYGERRRHIDTAGGKGRERVAEKTGERGSRERVR